MKKIRITIIALIIAFIIKVVSDNISLLFASKSAEYSNNDG